MIFGINSVMVLKKMQTIYINNFSKTKKRSYGDEARDFHSRKILKEGSNNIC